MRGGYVGLRSDGEGGSHTSMSVRASVRAWKFSDTHMNATWVWAALCEAVSASQWAELEAAAISWAGIRADFGGWHMVS